METCSVGAALIHADVQTDGKTEGQTDGWTDKTKLVGAVGDSANAPKQQCLIYTRNLIGMLRQRRAFRTEDPDHANEFKGHCS
jgi:hypothetical protein